MFTSQTTDFHSANYIFSFCKLQILISQTTDSHFANYRFPFRFANYSKPLNCGIYDNNAIIIFDGDFVFCLPFSNSRKHYDEEQNNDNNKKDF